MEAGSGIPSPKDVRPEPVLGVFRALNALSLMNASIIKLYLGMPVRVKLLSADRK